MKQEIDLEKIFDDWDKKIEPHTHCCECTPGPNYQQHLVHIQYPNCKCDPEKYILKKNDY